MQSDGDANYHQCIAIYQFLRFAYEQERATLDDGNPKLRLLDYVRRLEIHGEEKQLRQIPEIGHSLNAVRMLTIHGSKGLEFRAVYIPMLGKGLFPAKAQAQFYYHPTGLVAQDVRESRQDEELSLFFVALSRARDILCLSRATRYNGRGSNPSEFISMISPVLVKRIVPIDSVAASDGEEYGNLGDQQEADFQKVSTSDFEAEQLELYRRCPRRYYYDLVLGFSRSTEDSPFLRFHRCIYQVLDWAAEKHLQTGNVDVSMALEKLESLWPSKALDGHPFDSVYRRLAENMVVTAIQLYSKRRKIKKSERIPLQLSNGTIYFRPDHIEINEDGRYTFRKIKSGKLRKDEADQSLYGLYHAAAQKMGGDNYAVEVVSLASEAAMPIQLPEQNIALKLKEYDQAMGGIVTAKFPPTPKDARHCPRCPNYFICPAIPAKQTNSN